MTSSEHIVPAAVDAKPVADYSARLYVKQIDEIYRQGFGTLAFSFAVLAVTVLVLWPVMDPARLLTWAGVLTVLSALRLASAWVYLKRRARVQQHRRWAMLFDMGAALSGLAWGMLGASLQTSWSTAHQVFLIFVIAGIGSITASSYAVSARTLVVFLVSLLAPIVVRFGFSDAPTEYAMGLLVVCYGLVLGTIGAKNHRNVIEYLKLTLEKQSLIENLSQSNQELNEEVEQRRKIEEALRQERKLFINGPVIAFRWRAAEGWPIEYVSPNVSQFGLDADQLMRDQISFNSLIHPDDLYTIANSELSLQPVSGLVSAERDYRIVLPTGEVRWIYHHTIAGKDDSKNITHFDGYLLDITDRKQAEASLNQEKERAQVTLHSIGDGVITTDEDNRITYINPVAEELTGLMLQQAQGQPLEQVFQLFDDATGKRIDDITTTWQHHHRDQDVRYVRLHHQDGRVFDVTHSVAPISDSGGNKMGMVVVFQDATRTRALARELAYQASHDSLTDLLNRREFEAHAEAALISAQKYEVTHAVLYVDLDQFKIVNDTCGHTAGDELLKRISGILKSSIRESDILARLGGDEFGLLLHRCPVSQARQIADKLRTVTQETLFSWEDKVFEVRLCIGIVEINKDTNTLSDLMSQADMACYMAKDLGRDRVHVYQESDAEMRHRTKEMRWVTRIHHALEHDRFVLFGQEIRPLTRENQRTRRKEILLRMYEEDGELVPAGDFLSAAERYNLITTLDRWVIKETFGVLRADPRRGSSVYSINISGASLSQTEFLNYIKEQLSAFTIDGSSVCFEITETAAISHPENASRFVRELKALGCSFALDDFGRGLSSFGYLKDLSVDYLKIDGSFIRNIVNDSVDRALVAAINNVGHVMQIDTVAEYVENKSILEEVSRIGIDYAQGYHIHKPAVLPGQEEKLNRILAIRPIQSTLSVIG